MKLAFCIYKYFPFGGLQRDFLRIAKACQMRGHQIRIYVTEWQGEKLPNVDLIIVPKKGFSNHKKLKCYSNWVNDHLKSHPVNCVIGFNKMPGLDVYFAGDTCFAEKIFHKSFLYKLSQRCKIYLALEKAVFDIDSKTKLLLLTHKQLIDFKKHYHTENSRFYFLSPGIDMSRKYNSDSSIRRAKFRANHKISDNSFMILQIGSDFKRKGVDRSIKAIAALPIEIRQRVVYFVIGQYKSTQYLKIAKKYQLADQIHFLSGRDDVPDFLFSADLLLHPAREEAAGMILLESLVAGLPVIVSGISGYAYHVADANAGIVLSEPYMQSELNQILINVISKKDQLIEWHENAIKYGENEKLYNLAEHAADIILE